MLVIDKLGNGVFQNIEDLKAQIEFKKIFTFTFHR